MDFLLAQECVVYYFILVREDSGCCISGSVYEKLCKCVRAIALVVLHKIALNVDIALHCRAIGVSWCMCISNCHCIQIVRAGRDSVISSWKEERRLSV